jgi:broad specificity phosphatase PhoE
VGVFSTNADAEDEAAHAQLVELGGLERDGDGMAEGKDVDARLELDRFGGRSDCRQGNQAIVAEAVEGDMVARDDAIEAERFGSPGGIEDHLAGRAEPDIPTAEHDTDGRGLHGAIVAAVAHCTFPDVWNSRLTKDRGDWHMSHGTARTPAVFDRTFLTGVEGITELIFVRHGEQYIQDPRSGPVGDTVDPPLSERGRQQARVVGERLSADRIDAVYSSPLQRALETGREIARHHRIEPRIIHDLREVEVFRDIPADKPAAEFLGQALLTGIRERMLRERKWDVYPYSESSFEFRKRTVNAVEAIIAENEGKRVVIACHGGVINAYVGHIIGVEYDMFFRPAHASISVVYSGLGVRALQSLNDVHHLRTGEWNLVSH